MAFDIQNRPDRMAWVDFSEDEKYKLKYLPEIERTKYEKAVNEDMENLLLSHVIDWKGIFSNGEPLPCNDENKRIVLLQNDGWSVERLQFVLRNILIQENFFDYAKQLKNLKRASK